MSDTGRRIVAAEQGMASYPPSILPATGATAGIPGSWTPTGWLVPATPTSVITGNPRVIKASPATAWTTGQYAQTLTAGVGGRVSWNGTVWVAGAAAAELEGEADPAANPGMFTVAQLTDWAAEAADADIRAALDAEMADRNRASAVAALEAALG